MTEFSKTINNSIRTFGIGPTSLWGSMVWGSGKWGEGTTPVQTLKYTIIGISNNISSSSDLTRSTQKLLSNTIGSTSDLSKTSTKSLSNAVLSDSELAKIMSKLFDNAQAFQISFSREATKVFGNSISCDADLISEEILDSAGYANCFPGGMANAEDRVFDTWSESANPADNASEASDASTVWSEQ